jgi:hypothetical protein
MQRVTQTRAFLSELQHRAKPCWRLAVDCVSLAAVSMLDIWFYKGSSFEATGRLSYTAYTKPSARHVPLSYRSAHPWSVHACWPISEMRRLHELNSSSSGSLVSRARHLEKYRNHFMHRQVLASAAGWQPAKINRNLGVEDVVIFRLVVRWHPQLRGLGHSLNTLLEQWRHVVSRVWGPARARVWSPCESPPRLQVQVAYTSACAPLYIVLRRGSF